MRNKLLEEKLMEVSRRANVDVKELMRSIDSAYSIPMNAWTRESGGLVKWMCVEASRTLQEEENRRRGVEKATILIRLQAMTHILVRRLRKNSWR